MTLPADIDDWIKKNGPVCDEGRERLVEHESMWHAWQASTNGSMLAFIVRAEGLVTDDVLTLMVEHAPLVTAARIVAEDKDYRGADRLQDLDAAFAKAVGEYAKALKKAVQNPFPKPG